MSYSNICIVCEGFCKRCRQKICICKPNNIRWIKQFRNKIKNISNELKENANEEEAKFIDEFFKMQSQGKLFSQVNNFYFAEECKEIMDYGKK